MLPPGSSQLLPGCSGLDTFPIHLPFRSGFRRQSDARASIEEWEWDLHQSTITDLYRTQRKTLRAVMEILSQWHNFLPTEKMLKVRIKKWGLDKKLKAREVHAIRKLKQRRDAVGKRSQFWIRGQHVTWDEIEKYSKRSRLLVKIKDEDTIEIGQSSGVICKTPPPDPAAMPIPPIVNGSEDVQRPDEVLRISRNYYRGKIEAGQWTYDPENARICGPGGFQAYQRLCSWRTKILQSCQHVPQTKVENLSGDLMRGFRLINRCFDELTEIINDQDRSLIFTLLYTTDKLREKHQGVGQTVVGHVLQLSQSRLGNDHPVTHLWKRLWATDWADPSRLCAAQAFLDSLSDLQAGGYFTTSSIFADGYYYVMLELAGDEGRRLMLLHSKNLRAALGMTTASGHLADPPVPAAKEKQRIAQALLHVSAYLTDAREYGEVEKATASVHRWLLVDDGDNHHVKQCLLYCEANISRQKGEWEEAKKISRKQYEHGLRVFGPVSEKTLTTLEQHIKDVQNSGHQEEAERLHAEYDKLRRTWMEGQATTAAT